MILVPPPLEISRQCIQISEGGDVISPTYRRTCAETLFEQRLRGGRYQILAVRIKKRSLSKRLEYLDDKHVILALRTCQQHSQEIITTRTDLDSKYLKFLHSVNNLCHDLLRKPGGLRHVFGGKSHQESCKAMFIRVPYRTCLQLIADRSAGLRAGEALVPCGAWRSLLVAVFSLHLRHGCSDMVSSGCLNDAMQDERILQISRLMHFNYKKSELNPSSSGRDLLTCARVQERGAFFPPCVTSMLNTLQEHHRLGHHARVALTLFLKEAGMPVQQALVFWRTEYSVPGCQHGPSCSHSWQADERKYTYSVRHMYGLEGARRNYAAPCCDAIQGQLLAPGAVGGCPFSRLPEDKLAPLLGLEAGSKAIAEVLNLAGQQKPQLACQRLLRARLLALQRDKSTSRATEPSSSGKTSPMSPNTPNSSQDMLPLSKDSPSSSQDMPTSSTDITSSHKHNPTYKFSKPSHFYAICRDWSQQF